MWCVAVVCCHAVMRHAVVCHDTIPISSYSTLPPDVHRVVTHGCSVVHQCVLMWMCVVVVVWSDDTWTCTRKHACDKYMQQHVTWLIHHGAYTTCSMLEHGHGHEDAVRHGHMQMHGYEAYIQPYMMPPFFHVVHVPCVLCVCVCCLLICDPSCTYSDG